MLNLSYFFFTCMMIGLSARGQDVHFSQLDKSVMSTSWSRVGDFSGEMKWTAAHRSQWRSVSGVPYQTQLIQGQRRKAERRWAFGCSLILDKAGDGLWRQTQMNLGGSYHCFSDSSKFQFTVGIGGTWMQWVWDPQQLKWGNQWNGFDWDANAPNNEYFAEQNAFFCLHAGLDGKMNWSDKVKSQLSCGLFNLTSSRVGMGNDDYRVYPRVVLYQSTSFSFMANQTMEIQNMWMRQGTSQNWMSWIKDKLVVDKRDWNFWGGVVGVGARRKDAVGLLLGFFYLQHECSLSYDINFSPLQVATQYKGAWELVYQWTWRKPKKIKFVKEVCPEYY